MKVEIVERGFRFELKLVCESAEDVDLAHRFGNHCKGSVIPATLTFKGKTLHSLEITNEINPAKR
jgi:hypothetical protein